MIKKSRRTFLARVAAAGVTAAAALTAPAPCATHESSGSANRRRIKQFPSVRIRSVIRREESTLRLGGIGDSFHMSWAADDRQIIAIDDGVGWYERPKGSYNSRLWSVAGNPPSAVFNDIPDYPELIYGTPAGPPNTPNYYSFGTLALRGQVYQFLSTLNQSPLRRWIGAKLIYSPDKGLTWCNENGSTPVVWESWLDRSKTTMMFFEEPQESFSLLSFLQMGRNYELNQDGYVYVYSTNGNVDGAMNQLVMFRVKTQSLLHRQEYEYFAGLRRNGTAVWEKNINLRSVVHTFPQGWVNKTAHSASDVIVQAWLPSVVYNAPLGLYMMSNFGVGCSPDGRSFGKPSYLGFWIAPTPWGPWAQVHEEVAWQPANEPAARAYGPQIAPKWIAADGKSFWLVWSDAQGYDDFMRESQRPDEYAGQASSPEERTERGLQALRHYLPRYAFNIQRIDLEVS